MKSLVIATPFSRYDFIVPQVEKRLSSHRVFRLFDQNELNVEFLEKLKPEWIFFPHWPWIIPDQIHETHKCVVFHMTDLPYGRGGSPLQNLIVRGHRTTKLSAIKCVAEIDAGPVYRKTLLSLEGTAEEILLRAADLITCMVVDIVENDPVPSDQTGKIVQFKRRRQEDGEIYSLDNIDQVFDFIRMLDADNYPPAFIRTENLLYEFSEARLDDSYVEAKVRITRVTDE